MTDLARAEYALRITQIEKRIHDLLNRISDEEYDLDEEIMDENLSEELERANWARWTELVKREIKLIGINKKLENLEKSLQLQK